MNGPAEPRGGSASVAMEQRVRRLQDQVDALIEAVEVLARGLERGPMAVPPDTRAEIAARRTHELLLLAKSAPRDISAGA